jgi:hypothetical protein
MANPNIVNVTSILGATLVTTMITTANTTLLVNPVSSNAVYKIESIQASNTLASSTAILNLQISDGTTNENLLTSVQIATGSTLVALDKNSTIYLTEGYSLKGSCVTNLSIDLIVSYEIIS